MVNSNIDESLGAPQLEDIVKSVTKQTAAGLKFIHDKDVVHRDLKAENILETRMQRMEMVMDGEFPPLDLKSFNCWISRDVT